MANVSFDDKQGVLNYLGKVGAVSNSGSSGGSRSGSGTWMEVLANAWSNSLDRQAGEITGLADVVQAGGDKPSDLTMLTAASLKMNFMSQSASTSINSASEASQSLARKS